MAPLSMLSLDTLVRDLDAVRSSAPLVHNITNFVVMEPTANALLALGASPVMAHAREEMDEIVGIASALVLNIGTLSPHWIEAMEKAAAAALARGVPVVLDPVGAGASSYRTRTATDLLRKARPAVVRGNASEILTLAGQVGGAKGVDSTAGADEAVDAAMALARGEGDGPATVVSVSGASDLITDGTRSLRILNDTPLMARITGMGCTASALTGAFVAVNENRLEAAAHAMAIMAVAGEMAMERAAGPGTFLGHFHDALHTVDAKQLEARLRTG
jgi:hydroxyethylthiazole kinase